MIYFKWTIKLYISNVQAKSDKRDVTRNTCSGKVCTMIYAQNFFKQLVHWKDRGKALSFDRF